MSMHTTGGSSRDRVDLRHPSDSTWPTVEEWVETANRAGQRFGVGDPVTAAAVAAQWDEPVWSLDSDFGPMARLGWIRLHRPDGRP